MTYAFGAVDAIHRLQLVILLNCLPANALTADTLVADIRSDGRKLAVDIGIITRHDDKIAHIPTRLWHLAALFPVVDGQRLTDFAGTVVGQRGVDDILFVAEMACAHLREYLRQLTEDVPVGAALPNGVDGLTERMKEGVHISGRDILLLIPCSGRQHDIGENTRLRHPVVDIHDEVEFADSILTMPFLIFRQRLSALLKILSENIILRTEEVLHEELHALRRAADKIGAPDKKHLRTILAGIKIFGSKGQFILVELPADIVLLAHTGFGGLTAQVERIAVELRRRRQPAHTLAFDIAVEQRKSLPPVLIGQRRKLLIDSHFLISPLVGVLVDIAYRVHVARRTLPVEGESHLGPSCLRPHFLLSHIMAPSAAVDTECSAEHKHIDGCAVCHIRIIPLVDTGPNDYHALSAGFLSRRGESARRSDNFLSLDTRNLFLPLKSIGQIVVVALGTVVVAEATVDAIMGHQQVENVGTISHSVLRLHLYDGNLMLYDIRMPGGIEMRILIVGTSEVRVEQCHHLVTVVDERQPWSERLARTHILTLQIPPAFIVPPAADTAVRRDELARHVINGYRVPLGFRLYAEVVLEVGGPQEHARGITSVTGIL